jgi:hypothetical protein
MVSAKIILIVHHISDYKIIPVNCWSSGLLKFLLYFFLTGCYIFSRVKAPLSGFLQLDGNYLPYNLAPSMVCLHRGSILHMPLPKLVMVRMEGCTTQHRLLLEVLFIHCSSHHRPLPELLKWLAHLPMVISSRNILR